jgi:hypothetical protein
MTDKTSNYTMRWRRTRQGIVIAGKRYPANRIKRGTYKICEGVFKYQHEAGRFIARIKGADNNWKHLGVFDSIEKAILARDNAKMKERVKLFQAQQLNRSLNGQH